MGEDQGEGDLFMVVQPELTLFPQTASPLDDVWVALDLETTGLSPEDDDVIEVGAVKFRRDETIENFRSFVNPHRALDDFTSRYTGISQSDVDSAPPFSQVARDLVPFLGTAPVVGHNLAFDLGFLTSGGLRLSNPVCDTWDLAYVFMPESREYSLAKLAATLGIDHPSPHRAFEDAKVTGQVFLKLVEMASKLDVFTLAEMERLASRSSWVLSYLLRRLGNQPPTQAADGDQPAYNVGVTGFDPRALRERLHGNKALRANRTERKVDADQVVALLQAGGAVSSAVDAFEERPEQIAMARAVADAINSNKRLIVEAGTGVGKSLAYLLPAALYAAANKKRVVVSTNTINLQEQLLSKDIPNLVNALDLLEDGSSDELRCTQLKGRANYACLKRWSLLRSSDNISDDEARLLSKVLVWLRTTPAGDRSELNLGHPKAAAPWDRVSAQGALDCTGMNGVCFLRAARERAAASHVVVVNHALLMTDLTAGRALIPDHDVLIIDEAQHLEEVATKHLGFELSQLRIDDHLETLSGDRGLLNRMAAAFRGSTAAETRRRTMEEVAARIMARLPDVRQRVAEMFGVLTGLLKDALESQETRITSGARSQPAWSQLEIQWENVDLTLAELHRELTELTTALEGLEEAGLADYEALLMETFNAIQVNGELRANLGEFVPHPQPDGIYWVSRARRTGDLVLHKAPIEVGEQLEKMLFDQRDTVVLTSATLSAGGTFDHVRERTGLKDADELLLGSPFDYPRAALLCLPQDMPEPTSWKYQTSLEQAIVDATKAAGGRTMCLFTSHASLQAAAGAVRGTLQTAGIDVLAQGVDGTPHQVLRRFKENRSSVILGTSSFWEGVDLAGDSLRVLLVARLPFSVPTEPVFEARSELFEDSFGEYALPQAILRLRQGFGRLIRTKTDRGVVAILDKRVVSRRYGQAFLDSLPPVTKKDCLLRDLPTEIRSWLDR